MEDILKEDINQCWCGSNDLERFSDNYKKCNACKTLINSPRPKDEFYAPKNHEESFYGKQYWFEYQQEQSELPDIIQRTTSDIYERDIDWLKILLKYKLPFGNVFEIGCGNGSFLAILNEIGFDVRGIELSKWVVEYIKRTFNIRIDNCLVEDLNLGNKSIDIITAFDVFEHFTQPERTVKEVGRVLKDDGILIIQTPSYPEPFSFQELKTKENPFLNMLIPTEHLYLFNKESLKLLLKRADFNYIEILPGIFPYDMIIAASKTKINKNSEQSVEKFLSTINNKFLLSLIELNKKWKEVSNALKDSEKDRGNRLKIIEELGSKLEESEEDREARLRVIEEMGSKLEESEKDRAARLGVIEELNNKLVEKEEELQKLEAESTSLIKTIKKKIKKSIK